MGGKPDLDALDLRAFARELFGGDRVDIVPVNTEGMETRSFRVASGERVGCLRIARSTRGFTKDRWAHNRLGDRIPVPHIWEFGEIGDRRAFCLSEWIPGNTLQDLTAAEVDRVLPALFDMWSHIGNCCVEEISGYGVFDPRTLTTAHETWEAVLRAPAEQAESWDRAWTAPRSAEVAQLLDSYHSLVGRCPTDPRLVHGDWGTNNVLVADGRVTAILDWADAAIGDPLYDIAGHFWATWPPVMTCTTRQSAYCEKIFGGQPGYRDRVLCYDLHVGLREIGASLADGDRDFAGWAFHRCRELVQRAIGPLR